MVLAQPAGKQGSAPASAPNCKARSYKKLGPGAKRMSRPFAVVPSGNPSTDKLAPRKSDPRSDKPLAQRARWTRQQEAKLLGLTLERSTCLGRTLQESPKKNKQPSNPTASHLSDGYSRPTPVLLCELFRRGVHVVPQEPLEVRRQNLAARRATVRSQPETRISLAQNPVLNWLTQNHASKIKQADIRSYFWLGLSLANLHLPRF